MWTWVVLALYVGFPLCLLRLHRTWGAVAAIAGLWLPIEFGVLQAAGVPPWMGIAVGTVAGIIAFRSRPDVFNVSAAFDLRRFSLKDAGVNFVVFAVLGLPLAVAIGFIRPSFELPELRSVPNLIATIFLFNALPEEILFRGIIQHTIETASGSRNLSAIVAALIFGAAHLNNGLVVPNYRYFAVATLAGFFYGRAWRTHRNVLTSSVTHTMVNTVWRLFLR